MYRIKIQFILCALVSICNQLFFFRIPNGVKCTQFNSDCIRACLCFRNAILAVSAVRISQSVSIMGGKDKIFDCRIVLTKLGVTTRWMKEKPIDRNGSILVLH